MPRIAPKDVKEVLDTDLDGAELFAFIEDANSVVNNRVRPYTTDEGAMADVETYVAAHLATAKEPRVSRTSGAVTSVELETDGMEYWNHALLLDPTGRLDTPPNGYSVL